VPPDVQQVYEQMMRGQVAPALRALGFTGTSRVFRMRGSGHYGEVGWQKDGRWTGRQLLRFTANVAYWLGSDRIAELMPEPQPDLWWELSSGEPQPRAITTRSCGGQHAMPCTRTLPDAEPPRLPGRPVPAVHTQIGPRLRVPGIDEARRYRPNGPVPRENSLRSRCLRCSSLGRGAPSSSFRR
jgi:hypothetical protein